MKDIMDKESSADKDSAACICQRFGATDFGKCEDWFNNKPMEEPLWWLRQKKLISEVNGELIDLGNKLKKNLWTADDKKVLLQRAKDLVGLNIRLKKLETCPKRSSINWLHKWCFNMCNQWHYWRCTLLKKRHCKPWKSAMGVVNKDSNKSTPGADMNAIKK